MLYQRFVTVSPLVRGLTGFLNPQKVKNYAATTATWGAFGGLLAVYLLEPSTLLRSDVLQHIPVAGSFWKAKLEAAEQKD